MRASLVVLSLILPVAMAMAQKPDEQSSGAKSTTQESTSAKSGSTSSEVKSKSYKGTLVDASCAGAAGPVSSAAPPSKTETAGKSSKQSGEASANKTGEASRAAGGQSCDATTSTSEFGLKMRDGHVMRFDSVGNERVKEAFSSRKKWADRASASKAIPVTVNGTVSDDTLTVLSIQ